MGYSSCVAVVLLCSVTLFVSAQDCALPTDTEISNLLKPLLANSDGGSPSDYNPVIESVHYVCQAQGSIRDTYRAVSIISTFIPNGGPNPNSQRTNIFEFTCASGPTWETIGALETPPNGLISVPTRTDCFACNPIFATDRCRACDSSCSGTCLGSCVGSDTACCAVFTADGVCSTDTNCTSSGVNYSATESTDCSCTCNLCSPGYTANSNCTECSFTDICERDEPCQHGGDCILLSAPDNYTCNCTDTGFEGVDCTQTNVSCNYSCPSGYIELPDCYCLLVNVCQVDSGPCLNGGACILLSAPDNYTCDCTGTGYGGVNCSNALATFCQAESLTTTDRGQFDWPSTPINSTATLSCPNGPDGATGTRRCNSSSLWQSPDILDCGTGVTSSFTDLSRNIAQTNVTSDNVQSISGNLTVLVANATDSADRSTGNLQVISTVLAQTATLLSNPATVLTLSPEAITEVTENTVQILDNVEEWPQAVIESQSNQIVQSFETITEALVSQENFTDVTIAINDIAFHGERIQRSSFNGRVFSVDDMSNIDTQPTELARTDRDNVASISLPATILNISSIGDNVNLAFTHYSQVTLFPIRERPNTSDTAIVGSSIISASIGGIADGTQLLDPVIINLTLSNTNSQNVTNPRCVFWNFTAANGRGNWSSDGCTVISNATDLSFVTCSCNHLTNFACLVDISARTGVPPPANLVALEIVTYIGVSLSLIGLVITILTLVIFKNLREKDVTKFHVQLCLALLFMLIVFITGIDRVSPRAGCITVGVLIHYTALVASMWMGAEALMMFQKLVIVFSNITWRYLLIVSIVCWTAPLLPVVVTVAIDPDYYITLYESRSSSDGQAGFCFLGGLGRFLGAFLLPVFLILIFNIVIYILVIRSLILYTLRRNKHMGKTSIDVSETLKMLLGFSSIIFLFGLTWLFGVFTFVTEPSVSFAIQFVFSFFNAFQGFFIFLFFVVLNSDARLAWKSLLCPWKQEKKSKSSFNKTNSKAKVTNSTVLSNKSQSSVSKVPAESKNSSIPLDEKLDRDDNDKAKAMILAQFNRACFERYSTKSHRRHVEKVELDFFESSSSGSENEENDDRYVII